MAAKQFWKWKNEVGAENPKRVLELYGTIAEDSWFDDDITPAMFKQELMSGDGDIEVYINSPGGDCIAASQIYTMLMDYKGKVTVKIDGLAASAASVIAMAGTEVLMSPTAMMMIHDPMTAAFGNEGDMQKAIEMLSEVKESIINAYEIKTGLQRAKISKLMEQETWLNAKKAIELGFADGMIESSVPVNTEIDGLLFSSKVAAAQLFNKMGLKQAPADAQKSEANAGRKVSDLKRELEVMKHLI